MFIGIDLGTSGVKVVLLDETGQIIAGKTETLRLLRPHRLWSEQNPAEWWQATDVAMRRLADEHSLKRVQAIGLSGQMHGATLLDKQHRVLRPAILWNDGRSAAQCVELEKRLPQSRQVTGNLMMPGFTAPKLLWLKAHEPACFDMIDKVLLPKDWLRWKMSGDFASDMSDASGTMWLDVAKRDWSDEQLAACQLSRRNMPLLFEGNQITGQLKPDIAAGWGMTPVPLVAGGGDNAAGAVGVGMIDPGQGMLSLGTSGVYFLVSDGFYSNPQRAVHSFCHALPQRWHLMSVILSAASCLTWAAALTGCKDVPALINEAQHARQDLPPVWFLPYLSGERTPHNNPYARGVFFGFTHQHGRPELARAVMEGVGFALAQGMDEVHACGVKPRTIMLIGGGARSDWWRQMLADISGQTLDFSEGGDAGPALGAARLARMALTTTTPARHMLSVLPLTQRHVPNPERYEKYRLQRQLFSRLYTQLQPLMV